MSRRPPSRHPACIPSPRIVRSIATSAPVSCLEAILPTKSAEGHDVTAEWPETTSAVGERFGAVTQAATARARAQTGDPEPIAMSASAAKPSAAAE